MSRPHARFFGLAAAMIVAAVLFTPPMAQAAATGSAAATGAAVPSGSAAGSRSAGPLSSLAEAESLPIGAYGLIKNVYTQRCLSVHGASAGVGSQAFQHDCVGYADQLWRIDKNINGKYRITNYHTRLCLAVQGSNPRNGTPAYLYTCNYAYADQDWALIGIPYGPGPYNYWYIQNSATGLCLSVQGGNNVNGAPAFQHGCAGYADQRWY